MTRCWPCGYVYEMMLAHEHQHNETMLQLIQMIEAYSRWSGALVPPSRSPRARRWSWSRRGRRRSAPVQTASPTTTSARSSRRGAGRRSGSTARRSTNGAYAEFVAEHRRRAADVLGARTRDGWWKRTAMGQRRAAGPRRSRWSTSPGTRPTRSPAGPASACRPSRSGRRPLAGADRERANLDQLAFGCAPRRRLRRRRHATAAQCRCSATCGSGPRPTSSATRASRRSPTASTRRSSSATRTRCFAEAPGPPDAASSEPASATGTIPSAARSSPASAAPGTR